VNTEPILPTFDALLDVLEQLLDHRAPLDQALCTLRESVTACRLEQVTRERDALAVRLGIAQAELAAARAELAQRTPAPRPALRLVDDVPDWRCPICRSDVFTRDLHQPDRCVQCAKTRRGAA
jgi:hypothetical protein